MSELIDWMKEGSRGDVMETKSNDRPASINAMLAGGWIRVDDTEKGIDDMNAAELKELCKELDIEYTTKPEAIEAVRAKQAEGEE